MTINRTVYPPYVAGSEADIPDQPGAVQTEHLRDASVTLAKLSAAVASGATPDGVTLDLLGAGATLEIKNLGVAAGKIAADAVITVKILDLNVTTGKLAAAAVTKTKLAGGFSKVSVVAGEDETSTHQITVTGMAAGDEVVAVLVFTAAAAIVTMAAHAGTFTAAANKITPGTEVNNTNNQYLIFWTDLT